MNDRLLVTGPTFNELATAIVRSGHSSMIDENGFVRLGDLVIASDAAAPDAVRAARTAAVIDDLALRLPGNSVYDDGQTMIRSETRDDGIHIIEVTDGHRQREIVVPRPAAAMVAAEVIDCMSRPTA